VVELEHLALWEVETLQVHRDRSQRARLHGQVIGQAAVDILPEVVIGRVFRGEHRRLVDPVHRLSHLARRVGDLLLPLADSVLLERVRVGRAEARPTRVAVLVEADAIGARLAHDALHGVGNPLAVLGHIVARRPDIVVPDLIAVGGDDRPLLAMLLPHLAAVIEPDRVRVERHEGAHLAIGLGGGPERR